MYLYFVMYNKAVSSSSVVVNYKCACNVPLSQVNKMYAV